MHVTVSLSSTTSITDYDIPLPTQLLLPHTPVRFSAAAVSVYWWCNWLDSPRRNSCALLRVVPSHHGETSAGARLTELELLTCLIPDGGPKTKWVSLTQWELPTDYPFHQEFP